MKKFIILLVIWAAAFASPAIAQQPQAFYAKDFSFMPLNTNNVPVHLYEWLDAGKYVIIDVSASWCGPCWALHYSRLLDDIYMQYGPGSETDDVRVVFVEEDGATTDDDIQHESANSLGNWLEGTVFPVCNPSWEELEPFSNAYRYEFVPTLYLVCPNRSVIEIVEYQYMNVDYSYKTAEEVYSYIKSFSCPISTNVEVELSQLIFTKPLISFDGVISLDWQAQNRGAKDIDSVAVQLKADNLLAGSYTWQTKLEPYALTEKISMQTSQMPAGTAYLNFELLPYSDNGQEPVAVTRPFKIAVYSENNKYYSHFSEDFDSQDKLPALFGLSPAIANEMYEIVGTLNATGSSKVVGADGKQTNAICIPFYRLDPQKALYSGIMSVGHFSTKDIDSAIFEFDLSYALPSQVIYQSDGLELVTSYNQCTTWKPEWSETSIGMMTTPAVSGEFFPNSASQWKHFKVNINSLGHDDLVLGFRSRSAFGNDCYLDNFKLTLFNHVSAGDQLSEGIAIAPNPVGDYFTVSGYDGPARILDVMGRVVWSGNVAHGGRIGTESLSAGVYIVNLNGKSIKIIKR